MIYYKNLHEWLLVRKNDIISDVDISTIKRKGSESMKKMLLSSLAVVAGIFANLSASGVCSFIFYQPEMPEEK